MEAVKLYERGASEAAEQRVALANAEDDKTRLYGEIKRLEAWNNVRAVRPHGNTVSLFFSFFKQLLARSISSNNGNVVTKQLVVIATRQA